MKRQQRSEIELPTQDNNKVPGPGLFQVRNSSTGAIVGNSWRTKTEAKEARDKLISSSFLPKEAEDIFRLTGHFPYKVSRTNEHWKGRSY